MASVAIETILPATPDAIDRIVAVLSRFSLERGYRHDPAEFALDLVIDGQMAGGLVADTNWNWLHISVLAVDVEHRGRGHGTALMRCAEAIARERGCVGAWVDTFSFQAPVFYERLGYRRFGELSSYPDEHSRIFFSRRL
jgi:ribosomal protein S18 acetylase RimI-like enzyme